MKRRSFFISRRQRPAGNGATKSAERLPVSDCGLDVGGVLSQGASPSSAGGFTLMELLIVIAVLLVLTLVAIPNFAHMQIQTNENAAIASLRAIYEAEGNYEAAYPAVGFACSLSALGGSPRAGAASPMQAQVLANDLASGRKSGYTFAIVNCAKEAKKPDHYTSFEITAVPQVVGKSGRRGFCIDQRGETKADPAGGTNCTESLQ